MGQIAIKAENLGKAYSIGSSKSADLRHSIGNKFQSLFKPEVTKKEEFWALKDISFEINHGEAVGIIGRNGAGKSTLLKILSRITDPTTGRFEINGRVSSLLEVGTGFHPELSGRENIYLNGTILGMKRSEIKLKFDEIIDFSGVEKFIDTPVKHYSSGMKVRLAFSVAAHLEPEILIIDEVLAVGDAEFQKKCLGKMDQVSKEGGRTVIFVSHNMGAVQSLCNTGILLNGGKVQTKGEIGRIVKTYIGSTSDRNIYDVTKDKANYIAKVTMLHSSSRETMFDFESHQKTLIKIESFTLNEMKNVVLGVAVKDMRGNKITTTLKKINSIKAGRTEHLLEFKPNTFLDGGFSLDVALFHEAGDIFDYVSDAYFFNIIDSTSDLIRFSGSDIGSVQLNPNWE